MCNSKKTWDFKDQLAVGSRGEELFLEHYPRRLELIPEHYADFKVVSSGDIVELKTDTYNMNKTENFFIERWSDVTSPKKKPGSLWQSHAKGATIFCYMFVRHNIWFEFRDLPATIKRIEELQKGKGFIHIKNKGWITAGWKVPRAELADLYEIWEF